MSTSKKENILKRLLPYMGTKKALIPLALILSGLSAILNILPFVFVWLIIRSILSNPVSFNLQFITYYSWLAFICAGSGIIVYFAALMSSHLAAFHVEVSIQKIGMEKILSMPLGFFDNNSSGKIRKIVNDGAGTTHSFLAHQLPDISGSIISPIILLFLLFIVDWRMGIASLIPIALGFFTMGFMMNDKGKDFQKKYTDSLEEMSSESVEYIRGIPVVKTFNQSIFSFKRFHDSIIRYKEMVLSYTLLWQKPMTFYSVIMESAVFFLVPVAILLIGRSNQLPVVLSDFIFYCLLTPIFSNLLMRSMKFRQNKLIVETVIDRLDDLLDYPTMKYSKTPNQLDNYDLEFKNVDFSYYGTNKKAIDNVSFKVKSGETVALVGPSGGGKTTLARLAVRFWDVDNGGVYISGVNVKDICKEELMNTTSFVFQNTTLFKGTLEDNVLFGKKNVKKSVIDKAIKSSQSKEIIDNLDEGLQTVIGSKGTYLSGGEQQRISLARAMIKDAPIVLLDEATAFADPENEHLIQKALKELSAGKTTLMIAHRLTTVKDIDRIIVVKDGKIAEQGTHEELLKKGTLYKTMWDEYQKTIDWKIAVGENNELKIK